MPNPVNGVMGDMLALTMAGRLNDATALIRQSLGNPSPSPRTAPEAAPAQAKRPASHPHKPAQTAPRQRPARQGLNYLLHVPQSAPATGKPALVVMLHGCTQSAEDFARGTQMNALADEFGFIVVYPEQTAAANQQKCWNWFQPGDQRRDAGEPAAIAAIVREVVAEHGVDPARVYVAGLSAGGAAAAIMAAAYPDVFAAAGIHSGLACGSASDLPSAFAAMRGKARRRTAGADHYVPIITFHGGSDSTVHPDNIAQIHAAFAASPRLAGARRLETEGVSAGGRRYSCTALLDAEGRSLAEDWSIAGVGHAWSGGSAQGSYPDPAGPDASAEMMRFFFQRRLRQ